MKPKLCNWFGYYDSDLGFCGCNDVSTFWYCNDVEVFGRCKKHKMGPDYVPEVYTELTLDESIIFEILKS